jgi:hypothetical protein
MLKNPPLVVDAELEDKWRPGDFAARLADGKLFLPPSVVEAFHQCGVRTSIELLSYTHAFPTAIKTLFNWTYDEVTASRLKLCEVLKGHVPNEFMDPPKPRRRYGFGALPPEEFKDQVGKTKEEIEEDKRSPQSVSDPKKWIM